MTRDLRAGRTLRHGKRSVPHRDHGRRPPVTRLSSRVPGWLLPLIVASVLVPGCARGPRVLPEAERMPIDRGLIEYPSKYTLHRFATGLTAPSSMTFGDDGALLVGE